MRLTDLPMLLPNLPSRARLRAFWLVLALALGLVTGVVLLATGLVAGTSCFLASMGTAAVLAVPGLIHPYLAAALYRGWNWMVQRFCRLAVRYVTAVTFRTVGLVFGLEGTSTRFQRDAQPGSGWRDRGTLPQQAYRSEYSDRLPGEGSGGDEGLYAWLRHAAPPLSWAFLPFLWLVRLLGAASSAESARAEHIYTLF